MPFNAVIGVSFFSLVISIPALFGKNDVPFAFYALTGICTVGLYVAYIIPVYLRLRAGDSFKPGPGRSVPGTSGSTPSGSSS